MTTVNGCDSIITLDLTVNATYSENLVGEICSGSTYEVGDSSYTTSGIYITTMTTVNGCDSIVTLDLTVNATYSENLVGEICAGTTYEVGDSSYTTSGIYITTMTTVNGCDSIVTLDLTVNATYSENLVGEICAGSTYEVGDSSYTSSGIYITNMTSVNGCDSIVTLDLTVNATYSENLIGEICSGSTYEVGDSSYTSSGIYITNMTSVNGCDSIVTLDLTVNATYSENLVGEICAGTTYEVGDSSYTSSGIYITNMTSVNGCDSIVTLDLTVNATYSENLVGEICAGTTYEVGDSSYTSSGI